MSQLVRNSTYKNGVRKFGNYTLRVYLPKVRLNIPLGINDKKKAKFIQRNVNQIERDANRYQDKDYRNDIYIACSYKPKVDVPIFKFDTLFVKMIKGKVKDEVMNPRTREFILGKKNKSGLVVGGIYPMFIRDIFGKLDIRDVSVAHKDKLIDKLNSGYIKGGKRKMYSESSINIVKRNLISFFNWLVEEDYLDKIPFKLKQVKKKSIGQNVWIKPSVFEQICTYAHFTDVAYFKMAYHTGLRLRELRTPELIKSSSSITLYHTLKQESGNYWIEVYGKGGKVKQLPLIKGLKPYYDTMIANPKAPRTITANFKKACRLSGHGDFHFHNLRASFISNLAMSNTNPKVIKELARHSDLKITSEHYLADNQMNKNMLESWADDMEILV